MPQTHVLVRYASLFPFGLKAAPEALLGHEKVRNFFLLFVELAFCGDQQPVRLVWPTAEIIQWTTESCIQYVQRAVPNLLSRFQEIQKL